MSHWKVFGAGSKLSNFPSHQPATIKYISTWTSDRQCFVALGGVIISIKVRFGRHFDGGNDLGFESGVSSLGQQDHVDLGAGEDALLGGEPQCNDEDQQARDHYRHIAHVLRRDWQCGGEAVQDVEEGHPRDGDGVDGGAESAEVEVACWEDSVSASV